MQWFTFATRQKGNPGKTIKLLWFYTYVTFLDLGGPVQMDNRTFSHSIRDNRGFHCYINVKDSEQITTSFLFWKKEKNRFGKISSLFGLKLEIHFKEKWKLDCQWKYANETNIWRQYFKCTSALFGHKQWLLRHETL